MKTISEILNTALKNTHNNVYSFSNEFIEIIESGIEGSYLVGENLKNNIETFFNDLQQHGCISGMIGSFIYNSDCKKFYINHIDDLEEFKEEIEDEYGYEIENRKDLPHYVFMCWFCFEEFAYQLYNEILGNEEEYFENEEEYFENID